MFIIYSAALGPSYGMQAFIAACELFIVACGIQLHDRGSNPVLGLWSLSPPGKSLKVSFKWKPTS